MSAFIPSKDPVAGKKIMETVVADKQYELQQGCDGAWVAHPGMVKPIQELFSKTLGGKDHQITSTTNLQADTSSANGYATAPISMRGLIMQSFYCSNGNSDNTTASIITMFYIFKINRP
jgi:malate synthase